MPKNKGAHISTGTRLRDSPILDITSVLNQLQRGGSISTEEEHALRYYALLAEARAGTKVDEDQPQKSASPKIHIGTGTRLLNQLQSGGSISKEEAHALRYYALLAEARAGIKVDEDQQPQKSAGLKAYRGNRGGGHTLRHRMELVEIFRHFSKTDVKVTAGNFHQLMNTPVLRNSIIQWDKDFDKIQFDMAHGRGSKCTLSRSPVDMTPHIMDKTVHDGLQPQAAADSALHVLMDDIYHPNDISPDRTISFTASWRSRMTQECGVAYCSLKGEAGSVDKDAIAERMNEIRNICSDYKPDNIYNCDETGMYLKVLFNHSYTTEEFTLFCVNASGSSLARAGTVEALRPLVIGKRINIPCHSIMKE
ncbi:hypothetical protein EDD11_006182 [Mortierella claussenii]|nr:hypothetical protein EDD11_006182 [Mortierella claussenii]